MKCESSDCTFLFLPPNEDLGKAALIFKENRLEICHDHLVNYI